MYMPSIVLGLVLAPTLQGRAQVPNERCNSPQLNEVWSAIPPAEQAGVTRTQDGFALSPDWLRTHESPDAESSAAIHAYSDGDNTTLAAGQLVALELDGEPGLEVILALDAFVENTEGVAAYNTPTRSLIWALRCNATGYQYIGSYALEATEPPNYGTIDTLPGIRVLRAETLPGVSHAFLRLEHVDVQGGHDPRFVTRKLVLLHVVQGRLIAALDVDVHYSSESGPAREPDLEVTRSVIYQRTRPAAIRYRVYEVHPPSRRRRTVCSTTLRFNGRAFAEPGDACPYRL